MTARVRPQRRAAATPDAHLFPTRRYDLVKEFTVAVVIMTMLTVLLAAIFSSPDRKAVSLASWANAAPADVVATATAELAGTSTSAGYGAPYNKAGPGQKLGPLSLQRWAGVRHPIDSANDLVITPLTTAARTPAAAAALGVWQGANDSQRTTWATNYSDALTKAPDGDPGKVSSGDYGPVPVLTQQFLALARSGALEGLLTASSTFYASDETKPLLLLSDGGYLQDQARAEHLGGNQWGMMNETGHYPGQPWMWLYTFWYQIKPFSTSTNADALVWGVMVVLSALLVLLPLIPGLRSIPRLLPIHRLIWRPARSAAVPPAGTPREVPTQDPVAPGR